MTPILLDTDVLSELVGPRPHPKVTSFVEDVALPLVSTITLHELVYAATCLADLDRRERLMAWIASVRQRFSGRLIDVDADVADVAGRLRAAASLGGRPADPLDTLIAASALVHGATLATRNVRDFHHLGIDVIDPWADG